MGEIIVKCFIVIHSSLIPAKDIHTPQWVKGYVEKSGAINFYADMKAKNVNMQANSPSQIINENDCLYLKLKTYDGLGEPSGQ